MFQRGGKLKSGCDMFASMMLRKKRNEMPIKGFRIYFQARNPPRKVDSIYHVAVSSSMASACACLDTIHERGLAETLGTLEFFFFFFLQVLRLYATLRVMTDFGNVG